MSVSLPSVARILNALTQLEAMTAAVTLVTLEILLRLALSLERSVRICAPPLSAVQTRSAILVNVSAPLDSKEQIHLILSTDALLLPHASTTQTVVTMRSVLPSTTAWISSVLIPAQMPSADQTPSVSLITIPKPVFARKGFLEIRMT